MIWFTRRPLFVTKLPVPHIAQAVPPPRRLISFACGIVPPLKRITSLARGIISLACGIASATSGTMFFTGRTSKNICRRVSLPLESSSFQYRASSLTNKCRTFLKAHDILAVVVRYINKRAVEDERIWVIFDINRTAFNRACRSADAHYVVTAGVCHINECAVEGKCEWIGVPTTIGPPSTAPVAARKRLTVPLP